MANCKYMWILCFKELPLYATHAGTEIIELKRIAFLIYTAMSRNRKERRAKELGQELEPITPKPTQYEFQRDKVFHVYDVDVHTTEPESFWKWQQEMGLGFHILRMDRLSNSCQYTIEMLNKDIKNIENMYF